MAVPSDHRQPRVQDVQNTTVAAYTAVARLAEPYSPHNRHLALTEQQGAAVGYCSLRRQRWQPAEGVVRSTGAHKWTRWQ